MKSDFSKSRKWRALMVIAPLALLVVLAIATLGLSGAAGVTQYANTASPDQYGVANYMLYVANGRASDVKVIDAGSMSVVDTIPVPNEETPGTPGNPTTCANVPNMGCVNLNSLNTGLMNWEVHGVAPSADRSQIYAVGALSGGSYSTPGDTSTPFNVGDYRLYEVSTSTKTLTNAYHISGAGQPVNPVGYCGLEYNLNDVNNNIIIGTSMNASNSLLASVFVGHPDLGVARGTGYNEHGGWTTFNLTTGSNAGFVDTYVSGTDSLNESSTCGIAFDAAGTHAWASQMFDPVIATMSWDAVTATGTVTGGLTAPAGPNSGDSGQGYHQETTDKAKGHLFAAEGQYVDVLDMSTNAHIAAIDMYALTFNDGLTTADHIDTHSLDFAHSNGHDTLFVTVRHAPDMSAASIVAVDIDNINNPFVIGVTQGLDPEACGVYADSNKSLYYKASGIISNAQTGGTTAPFTHNALGNDLLFVAGGRDSNIKVVDPSSMSIVDRIPVPDEVTPGTPGNPTTCGNVPNMGCVNLYSLNPGLMDWEVHGVLVSKDRTKVYAVGALSGGSYTIPGDTSSPFNVGDYKLYTIGTATKTLQSAQSLDAGTTHPVNPVGYCGIEYALNDETSTEIVTASMNASNHTLQGALGADLSAARGTGYNEHGGWNLFNLSTGSSLGFLDTYNSAAGEINNESSTCGIAWYKSGLTTYAFASQMFQPIINYGKWTGTNGTTTTFTGTGSGTIAASTAPGTSYHQSAMDKTKGILYVTSDSGNVDMFSASTHAVIGSVRVRELTGSPNVNVHSVKLSPSDSSVLYVDAHNVPDPGTGMPGGSSTGVAIIKIDDTNHPSTTSHLLGVIPGMGFDACGVYAIPDKATWQAVQNGTKPVLSLNRGNVYWASYSDYAAHQLSVDLTINASATSSAASGVQVTGATFDRGGVSLSTPMPLTIGNIGAGSGASFTLKYDVTGLTGNVFYTTTQAAADGGLYTYP